MSQRFDLFFFSLSCDRAQIIDSSIGQKLICLHFQLVLDKFSLSRLVHQFYVHFLSLNFSFCFWFIEKNTLELIFQCLKLDYFFVVFCDCCFWSSKWLLDIHFLLLKRRWGNWFTFCWFFGCFLVVFLHSLCKRVPFYRDWPLLKPWFFVLLLRVFWSNLWFSFHETQSPSWTVPLFPHKAIWGLCSSFPKCSQRRQLPGSRLYRFCESYTRSWSVWTFWTGF